MAPLRSLAAAAVIAIIAVQAAQSTSHLYLGGGLTILSQNNLDGAPNNGTAAILVSQPSPYYAAKTACMLLGEQPWNPDTSDFSAALNTAFIYQIYQNLSAADQIYWISKVNESDDACRGMDAAGKVYDLDCRSEVPTLCTQSAPISTSSYANNSREWQLTTFVGTRQVRGYRDYHTFKFRGLRYADRAERFTYSQMSTAMDSDGDEIDATNAGADCSQPVGDVKNGSSEDCLFANVWTPFLPPMGNIKKEQLKPVMLYLYGGGFTSGSGKNPNTDGTNLASRGDVVVVSVNYRVGSIGFLNLNDGVHKGNYGISDMVSALQWVNKYIRYFGGDPDRVTLFGESSGAQGTHIILGVEKAKGLFQRAIMQSGPDGYPSQGKVLSYGYYDTLQHNYDTTTKKVLKDAGCSNATDTMACLGKLSGFELVNLTTNANGVVVDGTYIKYHELVVNSTEGSYATNVTVMAGINRDESGVLIDDAPSNGSSFADYFNKKVAAHFSMPSNTTVLLGVEKWSPAALGLSGNFTTLAALTPDQIFNASMRIATDAVFTCFAWAKLWSGAKHGALKSSYAYEFNRTYQTSGYTRPWCVPPKTADRPNGDPDGEYYKCHAGEQMVVFGTVRRGGLPDRDGHDVPFMQLVIDYWSAFARTGDPNPDKGYLLARGHMTTLERVERTGRWEAVNPDKPTLRLLQWNGGQLPFGEGETCKALGAPLDVLEAH
ncbi:alpha/beta-hydrolase [Diplogelasinospora grovesii]|uniref:Alpha/beta-hydrolase n=1 Tax=Diplogelasinospora grovesii TaxID=303347 RepID=A0AAN6S7Y5_9PEZI|nr:alpha/beta-hydrolase [Diplogelasinospora grovesii]